VLIEALVY
jgi:hypothetical protein